MDDTATAPQKIFCFAFADFCYKDLNEYIKENAI